MATYQYKARNAPGALVEGALEAESRLAALDQLSQQGFFPLKLEADKDPGRLRQKSFLNPVRRKDLGLFTRQLADLLESGVALPMALSLVQGQLDNRHLTRAAQEILEKVRGGKHLSQALRDYPSIFFPLYVSLIGAGEVGGNLPLTMGRLADFIEQEDDFRARVQAALAYPILIACVGAAAVVFLMVFAGPKLAAMFTDMGQRMPWATRALMHVSTGMASFGGWLLLAAVLGAVAFVLAKAGPQQAWSRLAFRLPIWGPVVRKSLIVRFARTLATLLAGGVPIVESLRVVADVMDHPLLKERVLRISEQVEQGESLSESLKQAPEFPTFICHMVAVAETVNTLEKSLNKVATAYERETDRTMKLATSLLEPAMILAIGSVVGVIVIAMLLPIFQISAFVK